MVMQERAFGAAVADTDLMKLHGVLDVTDIKERDLHALLPRELSVFGDFRIFFEANDVVFIVRMQIIAVAGDLEFSQDLGIPGIAHIDYEERIDGPEGHHVGAVSQEARGIDLFPGREIRERAHGFHAAIEDVEVVAGCTRRIIGHPLLVDRRRDAEVVLTCGERSRTMFVHRELIQDPAGDLPLRLEGRAVICEVEPVEPRAPAATHSLPRYSTHTASRSQRRRDFRARHRCFRRCRE